MFQRTLDLHYDQLIIGADLDALYFSCKHSIPILFKTKVFPPPYSLEPKTDLQTYIELLGLISLGNLAPFADLVYSMRLEDENTIKIATKENLSVTVTFDYLYISDGKDLEGLPPPTKMSNETNLVLDYLNVHSGTTHEHEMLESKDNFVRKVYFYQSKRLVFIQADKKDCVAVSLINNEDINDREFSDFSARMKTLSLMKNAGIKGRWDKTNNRFKTLKAVSDSRKIYPAGKHIYTDLPRNFKMIRKIQPVTYNKERLYENTQKA